MRCPSCERKVSSDWRVCAYCGASLQMRAEPPNALLSAAVTLPARHDQEPIAPMHPLHGREEEARLIKDALRQGYTLLLSGPSGIGKTALAQEAAYRLCRAERTCWDGVLWLADLSQASLPTICDAMARALGSDEVPRQAPERKPDMILEMLANRSVLIVLDGIASPGTIGEFLYRCLPPLSPVLATSSQPIDNPEWSFLADIFDSALSLPPLTEEATIDLFQERAGSAGDESILPEVCHLLQGHPLALVLAASTVQGDAERLRQVPGWLAEATEELGPAAEEQVALAPLSCLYEGLDNGQRDCFRWLVAGFGANMGLDLLCEISGLPPDTCQARVEELAQLSLIIHSGDRVGVTPAVRELGRELLGNELQPIQEEALAGVVRYTVARAEHTVRNREQLVAELDGIMGALRYAMASEKWDEAAGLADNTWWALESGGYWTELIAASRLGIHAAELLDNLEAVGRLAHAAARVYGQQGNQIEARRMLDRSLEASEKADNVSQSAIVGKQIGSIAQVQGDYEGSLEYFERSLKASEEAGDRTSTADSLNQIGIAAYKRGDYETAKRHYQEALEIRQEDLGPDHPEVAEILNNLALLFQEQGNYAAATDSYEEALQIYRAGPGPDSPAAAGILHNMAGLCRATGEYGKAESLYREALDIRRETVSPNDLAVAQTLNDLAGLYITLGRYAEAVQVQQQAVEIARGTVGDHDPYFAEMVKNLAGLYYMAGDLQLSRRFYENLLDLQRAMLGSKHPDTAETMNNLALVYQALGEYERAEALYNEALEVCEMTLRGDHPLRATIIGNLAGLFEATNRYDEAEDMFKQALEIRRSALGDEHPDVAQALGRLASFYEFEGEDEQARKLWQEAIAIYRSTVADLDFRVAHALHRLGILYESAGDLVKAESCYREAMAIYGDTLGEAHPDTAAATLSLAELYYATKQYSDAELSYRQALEYYQTAEGAGEQRALILYSLGVITRETGAHAEAEELFQQSLEIKQKMRDRAGIASTYSQLGQTAQKAGQLDRSFEYYNESIQISREIGDRPNMARTLHQLGIVAQAQGDHEKAREYYEGSLEISQKLNMQGDIANTLHQLSLLARETGETEQAESLVEQSQTIYETLNWLAALRKYLPRKATEDDLRAISAAFGIDYDHLPGKGAIARAEELVTTAYRQDKLEELVKIARDRFTDLSSNPKADA